jgi:glutamate 5-kinase
VILRLVRGEAIGTFFPSGADRLESRKRWILSGLNHPGTLTVDDGAARALLERGASLLPAGITGVEGGFGRGDTVEIVTLDGRKIAAGIANYPSPDVRAIMGRRSNEIERILTYSYGDYVVHRDNLAALSTQRGKAHAV